MGGKRKTASAPAWAVCVAHLRLEAVVEARRGMVVVVVRAVEVVKVVEKAEVMGPLLLAQPRPFVKAAAERLLGEIGVEKKK